MVAVASVLLQATAPYAGDRPARRPSPTAVLSCLQHSNTSDGIAAALQQQGQPRRCHRQGILQMGAWPHGYAGLAAMFSQLRAWNQQQLNPRNAADVSGFAAQWWLCACCVRGCWQRPGSCGAFGMKAWRQLQHAWRDLQGVCRYVCPPVAHPRLGQVRQARHALGSFYRTVVRFAHTLLCGTVPALQQQLWSAVLYRGWCASVV